MPHAEICRFYTRPVNKKVTRQIMPGVNLLCYHYCKGARVHRWNDVPLVDAPPGNVSPINMIDHGPAPSRPCSVSLHYTDKWPVACHKCDRSVLSVSNGRIDCWYRVNNGQHIPLSCQAHISGAFAHVFADTHRQSCTTAQAALFQGICNVQSVQGIFTSELYSQNIPEQSTVQSAK